MGFKQTISNVKRLKRIAEVFVELELHYLIDLFSFERHLPWHKRVHLKKATAHTQPETIRLIFERLGGAFLKLGQLLALRPDLVGQKYSKEFEKLLDDVEIVEFEKIKEVIESNLTKGLKTFKKFDKKAIACGSIAQVYKAQLQNGTSVAVKVRKAGIEKEFNEDIEIMFYLAEIISKKYDLDFMDPKKIVKEFKRYTLKELDFMHEQRNMLRFSRNFENQKKISVPKVYEHYCNESILVMEFIEGEALLKKRNLRKNKIIVENLNKAVYKQLFEDGFFHADLHPGNVLVKRNGDIVFIDFGIVGFINKELKQKIRDLFIALIEGDLEKTALAILSLNTGNCDVNLQTLEEEIYHCLGDYYNMPINKVPIPKILSEVIDIARRSNLNLPAQIVLFSKSLLTLDGSCRKLDPSFNVVVSAKPYIKRLMREEFSVKSIAKDGANFAIELRGLINKMPKAISSVERKINNFEESLKHIDNTGHYMSHVVWKVSKLTVYTVLFSTMLISSSILTHLMPAWNNISWVSIIGAGLAVIFLALIIMTLKDDTDLKLKS